MSTPGSDQQVNRADERREEPTSPRRMGLLPLEAEVRSPAGASAGGWAVSLPVRAEDIRVDKRFVVVEEVALRRQQREEVVRLDERIQREQLRVESTNDLDVTQPMRAGRERGPELPPQEGERWQAR